MEAVRGASILIVEDERALATAVGDALGDAGFRLITRVMAKKRSPASDSTYDVIICDLKMPHVDGMTLYRAIASATPALSRRIIFVTGDVAEAGRRTFSRGYGCRWLAKPFRLTDLLRAVRDTLG